MKKLIQTLSVLLCLSVSTQLSAQSDEMKNLQSEKRSQIPNLHSMLYQHFNEKGALTPDGSLSLAAFKDKARQDKLYQLNTILGLAIDEGYPLNDLEQFGVTYKKEGRYRINLQKYPQWANPSSFTLILSSMSESFITDLTKLGFANQDINQLRRYLSQHPESIETLQTVEQFIKEKTHTLSINTSSLSLAQSMNLLSARHQVSYEAERAWLFKAFDLFNQRKQRILLANLQSRLGSKSFAKAPIQEYHLKNFGNGMLNGENLKSIRRAIKQDKRGENQ